MPFRSVRATEYTCQCQSHRIHLPESEPQNTPARVRATEYTCRCQTSEYTCHCQKPPVHVRTHPVSVRPQNTPVSVITQNTPASVITQNTPVKTQLLVPDIAQNIFVSSVSIRKKNISSNIFSARQKRTNLSGSQSHGTKNTPIRPVHIREN